MSFPINPNPGDSYQDIYNTTWIYAGPINGWYRQTVFAGNQVEYSGSSFTRWRKTYSTLPTPATTISGNSDSPATELIFNPNNEQVFVNGALLQRGVDYTTPNSTSITLLSGPLIAGDVVEVFSIN